MCSSDLTQTRFGSPYAYFAEATDADGDPLSSSLVHGPAGMVLTNGSPSPQLSPPGEGVLLWTPQSLGSFPVSLAVSDGRAGGAVTQQFTITVSSTLSNSPPLIVSTPPLHATAGQPYEYNLAANDPDDDLVTWRLVQAPVGVSLNAATGALRWNPTLDQLGTNVVTVEAQDALLATDTQTWQIDVGCVNRPPQITSVPPTQAQTEDPYLYAPRATDPDGDRLTWSLVQTNAAGMTIDATTGLIRWTPTTNQVGSYLVRVRASDGRGGSDTQEYTLYASNLRANKAPIIVTTPQRGATIGRPYAYTVRATDADADTLTLQLLTKPTGATLTQSSSVGGQIEGVINWTPTVAQAGPQEFINFPNWLDRQCDFRETLRVQILSDGFGLVVGPS